MLKTNTKKARKNLRAYMGIRVTISNGLQLLFAGQAINDLGNTLEEKLSKLIYREIIKEAFNI